MDYRHADIFWKHFFEFKVSQNGHLHRKLKMDFLNVHFTCSIPLLRAWGMGRRRRRGRLIGPKTVTQTHPVFLFIVEQGLVLIGFYHPGSLLVAVEPFVLVEGSCISGSFSQNKCMWLPKDTTLWVCLKSLDGSIQEEYSRDPIQRGRKSLVSRQSVS